MNASEAGRRDGLDIFSFYRNFHRDSADNSLQPIASGQIWIELEPDSLTIKRLSAQQQTESVSSQNSDDLYTGRNPRGTTENPQNPQTAMKGRIEGKREAR